MYMILLWLDDDNYLTCIQNEDGSVKLFNTLQEADNYANNLKFPAQENTRVISIEAVKEE